MNKTRMLFAAVAMTLGGISHAQDVGMSISAGQPGFYGRIDIGGVPQPPRLVYAQPIVIEPAHVAVAQPPLYLHVPPGHAKNWRKHCARYNACGQPVTFAGQLVHGVYVPPRGRHDRYNGGAPVPSPRPAAGKAGPRSAAPVTSVRAVAARRSSAAGSSGSRLSPIAVRTSLARLSAR
jgi:hypothetical protein